MEKLTFYDLKKKKKFTSSNYKKVNKRVRNRTVTFAIATAPSGIKSWRILGSSKKKKG